MKHLTLVTLLAALACAGLHADFSYDQTTQLTGGAMKSMAFMSKQLREPIRSTVVVKGDRMAHVNSLSASIIDLKAETITHVDFQRKSYSVVTFAQMADAMKQAEAKAKSRKNDEPQMEFTMKPSVKETGQTQVINGMTAREVVLTIEFEGTDPKTNQRATMMTVTSDMWLAPEIAGYQEIKNFYRRMAQKLAWAPGMSAMMPGGGQSSRGMAALYEEAAKLNGVPVRQITKMGFSGAGAPQGEAGEAQPEQQQPEQQQQAEAEKPSLGGALGRLGGGRLGGLGGLGRRKTEQTTQEKPVDRSEPRTQQRSQGGPATMMEMTSDLSGFSSAAADTSKFEIPAGFKQVDSPLLKMR